MKDQLMKWACIAFVLFVAAIVTENIAKMHYEHLDCQAQQIQTP